MRGSILCLAHLLIFSLFTTNTIAQSAGATDIQKKEAEEIFSWCEEKSDVNRYMTCDCLVSEYLEKRIELGPTASRFDILGELQGRCKNVSGTIEREHTLCIQESGFADTGGYELKPYCECYAHRWGKLFEEHTGKLDGRAKSQMRVDSKIYCHKAEAYN